MGGGVNISTIFDLDSFMWRGHESPELVFHVVFRHGVVPEMGDSGVFVINHPIGRSRWGVRFEPEFPEFEVSCLEGGKAVLCTFVEAEVPTGARYACEAKPLVVGND